MRRAFHTAVVVLFLACTASFREVQMVKTQYADASYPWPSTRRAAAVWGAFVKSKEAGWSSNDASSLSREVFRDPALYLVHMDLGSYFAGAGDVQRSVHHTSMAYRGGWTAGDHANAGIAVYNLAHLLVEVLGTRRGQDAAYAELRQVGWGGAQSLARLSAVEILDVAHGLLSRDTAAAPMRARAGSLRIKALVASNRAEEAHARAEQHLRDFPDDAMALNEVAILFASGGNAPRALTHWVRALTAAKSQGDRPMLTLAFNNLLTRIPIEMVMRDRTVPEGYWAEFSAVGDHAGTVLSWLSQAARAINEARLAGVHPDGQRIPHIRTAAAYAYGMLSLHKAMATGLHWRHASRLKDALLAVLGWCADVRALAQACSKGGATECGGHSESDATLCGAQGKQNWHPYWFVHLGTSDVAWTAHKTALLQTASRARTLPLPSRRGVSTSAHTPARASKSGICSYDFRDHAFGYIVEGWLRGFNASRSSLSLLSLEHEGGEAAQTSRLRQLCAAHDCSFTTITRSASDLQGADLIAAQGIHVLVDAMGPTFGGRPDMMAHRPAPLIVLQNIPCSSTTADATTTDAVIVPPETLVTRYSQSAGAGVSLLVRAMVEPRAVYMPHAWFLSTFNTTPECGPVRPQRCAAKARRPDSTRALRLGALMNVDKLDPDALTAWANILRAHPSTVLIVLGDPRAPKLRRLQWELAARGVHAARLRYRPQVANQQHLLSQAQSLDLVLDTWLCNGHTTVAEALWAGVPVLTLEGEHLHNRVASSLLQASSAGLGATGIAHSATAYEHLADALLCNDAARLPSLRRRVLHATGAGFAVRAEMQIADVERSHRVLLDSVAIELGRGAPGGGAGGVGSALQVCVGA